MSLPEHQLALAHPPGWTATRLEPTEDTPGDGFQIETRTRTGIDADLILYVWFRDPEARDAGAVAEGWRSNLRNSERRGATWKEFPPQQIAGLRAIVLERYETLTPPPGYEGTEPCDCVSRWYIVQWRPGQVLEVELHSISVAAFRHYISEAEQLVRGIRST